MALTLQITGGTPLTGQCLLPGDKSISHRALLLGAIAQGITHIRGFLPGEDCLATLRVIQSLGVQVDTLSPSELLVHGKGLHGLSPPQTPLNCENSGTTMRLLAGLMAPQTFNSLLVGTPQLQGRPMHRIISPLQCMGAQIHSQNQHLAPMHITGTPLHAHKHHLKIASAQVKSAILLAGLYATGETLITEPAPARDHTERMLHAMGAPITIDGDTIRLTPPRTPLTPLDAQIPADPSSAAFLLVAASLLPKSKLSLPKVGTNPRRDGLIRALERMGANLTRNNEHTESNEPIADLHVEYAPLHAQTFSGNIIVTMIDELPILALAATQATGVTIIRDAAELRVKETDRIATTAAELRKLGANIEERPDGMLITGPTPLHGTHVNSHGDHRLAMTLTIAGLLATGTTTLHGAEVSADSFPGFIELLTSLGAHIEELKA